MPMFSANPAKAKSASFKDIAINLMLAGYLEAKYEDAQWGDEPFSGDRSEFLNELLASDGMRLASEEE